MAGSVVELAVPSAEPERGPDRNLRDALRIAIADRVAAQAAVETAESAERRATQAVADCECALASVADIDDRIALYHAANVKEWVRSGGDHPVRETPAELLEHRLDRDRARDRLAGAQEALTEIRVETEAAKTALAECKRRVGECACAVMAGVAETIADELDQMLIRAERIYRQLECLSRFWPTNSGASPKQFQLSPRIKTLLIQRGYLIGHLPPTRPADGMRAWGDVFQQLSDDPDAPAEPQSDVPISGAPKSPALPPEALLRQFRMC